MTENNVQKIWVKNVVILGWFPFLAAFCVYGHVLLFRAFFNHINENNNKMTENDVAMVWVQKEVIMCWFVNFVSFRAN